MWGIYTKLALKKGDFITEYVGEVISQEEAERRGVIYDKLEASYLFNLSSDQVIDAGRKGKQSTRRSNKHMESQVQQTLTDALAPYLEQFQSMLAENAARAVRPCSTGYIR